MDGRQQSAQEAAPAQQPAAPAPLPAFQFPEDHKPDPKCIEACAMIVYAQLLMKGAAPMQAAAMSFDTARIFDFVKQQTLPTQKPKPK